MKQRLKWGKDWKCKKIDLKIFQTEVSTYKCIICVRLDLRDWDTRHWEGSLKGTGSGEDSRGGRLAEVLQTQCRRSKTVNKHLEWRKREAN